jgi:hypothetical protein
MKAIPCFMKSSKMKNLIIVLSVCLTAITSVSAQTAIKKEAQKTMYACPMHPDEASFKKGKCSKCGMDMKEINEQKREENLKH